MLSLSLARNRSPSSPFHGLQLGVQVLRPTAAAHLWLTLCDSHVGTRNDEMRWFDCDPELLSIQKQDWTQVRLPLDGFHLASGTGTRTNDFKPDLSRVEANEINLVSEGGPSPKATIFLIRRAAD